MEHVVRHCSIGGWDFDLRGWDFDFLGWGFSMIIGAGFIAKSPMFPSSSSHFLGLKLFCWICLSSKLLV